MPEIERLTDHWAPRDLPVLIEIARHIEAGRPADNQEVAKSLDRDEQDVAVAFQALHPQYIDVHINHAGGGGMWAVASALTSDGRRATGLWPREDEAASALIDLLEQAADGTTDEDDAGALRKAGRLLKSVPGNVLADVTAALIRQQVGL